MAPHFLMAFCNLGPIPGAIWFCAGSRKEMPGMLILVLPHKAYEYAMVSLGEVGRMLGGWIKEQGGYEKG
jgi:hypothetical protein